MAATIQLLHSLIRRRSKTSITTYKIWLFRIFGSRKEIAWGLLELEMQARATSMQAHLRELRMFKEYSALCQNRNARKAILILSIDTNNRLKIVKFPKFMEISKMKACRV